MDTSLRIGASTGRNVWLNALLGGAIGFLAVLVLYGLARLLGVPVLIGAPPDMTPLVPLPVYNLVFATFLPALAAALFYLILQRLAGGRTDRIFQVVAALLTVASLGGPFSLPLSLGNQVVLALMHIVTAAAIVWALTLRR